MLVCFFLFELIWEFTGSVNFLHKGYAPISFIGLYILAAYLRKRKTKLKTGTALTGFFLCCIAITLTMSYDNIAQTTLLVSFEFYSSPFVIAAAAFLLLSFTGLPESVFRKRPWEKLIPWLSTSCFAVYLIHVGTPFAFHLYVTTVKETYYAHPASSGRFAWPVLFSECSSVRFSSTNPEYGYGGISCSLFSNKKRLPRQKRARLWSAENGPIKAL